MLATSGADQGLGGANRQKMLQKNKVKLTFFGARVEALIFSPTVITQLLDIKDYTIRPFILRSNSGRRQYLTAQAPHFVIFTLSAFMATNCLLGRFPRSCDVAAMLITMA